MLPQRTARLAIPLLLAGLAGAAAAGPRAADAFDPARQNPSPDPSGPAAPEPPALPQPGTEAPMPPETARALALETLQSMDWLLRGFDSGNPLAEKALGDRLTAVRARFVAASPDEMAVFAAKVGPSLPDLHRQMLFQTALLATLAGDARDAGGAAPPAGAKSLGFPGLRPDVPDYPNVTADDAIINFAMEVSSDFDAVTQLVDQLFNESVDIPLCVIGTTGDRANRRPDAAVMALVISQNVQSIINALLHDVCGGASVDVVIFSGGYSCDICCIFPDLIYGITTLIHETKMTCEDMIDGAEIEAAYHHAKATHAAVAHVHGDIESLQGTADQIVGDVAGVQATADVILGTANDILDIVTCKTVPALNRHHGCDGLDSNCNGTIDECAEDAFGPELHVDEAVGVPWYASQSEAVAAVLRAVRAADDCRSVMVTLDSVSGACGAVNAVVSAQDACGNTTTVTSVVKVDGVAPAVTIAGAMTDSCHASIDAAEAAVLAATTVTDNCTPAGQLAIAVQSTVTDCSLRVRVTATDLSGRSTSDAVTVRVDTRSPAIDVSPLLLGCALPRCFETVADAEAAVLAATGITDNCSAATALVPVLSSTGSPCSLRVTASVADECGRNASDDVVVRVDSMPPAVTASVVTSSLWPANHELVDVGLSFTATDNCAGEPVVRLSVTSDEPTASADGAGGDKAPDALIVRQPDGTIAGVRLRAERSSSGNGRAYRIVVEATDPCGHVGAAAVTVSVPPRANAPAVDDGQLYDATGTN